MPNILRRFLETYIGFVHPSIKGWGESLDKLIENGEDRKLVHKIADELSHNENTKRVFTMYNPDEIGKAIDIIFKSFENDEVRRLYFQALRETIGISSKNE